MIATVGFQKGDLHYRGYVIHFDGTEWVAEAAFPDDDSPILQMGSRSIEQLMASVDQIYETLEQFGLSGGQAPPAWLANHMAANKPERIRMIPEIGADGAPKEEIKPSEEIRIPGRIDRMLLSAESFTKHPVGGKVALAAVPLTFLGSVMIAPVTIVPFFAVMIGGGFSPVIRNKITKRINVYTPKKAEAPLAA